MLFQDCSFQISILCFPWVSILFFYFFENLWDDKFCVFQDFDT
jgi:hypothetical protein